MIDRIRYMQLSRQANTYRSLSQQQIATYKSRDPLTGQRMVEMADGGVDRGQYLAHTDPAAIPQYQKGGNLGVPGYLNNR